MDDNVITRKQYKDIKKYDRNEMEKFLKNPYGKGFKDGAESGNSADFKIKLVKVLSNTKGIGITLFDRIMDTVKEMERC